MPPDPQLSKPLQIKNFKALFSRLNPGIGVDVIDWEKVVVEGEYSMENLENLAEEYPQYRWTEDEKELAALKQRELEEHREELDYMLHSLPEEMQPDYKKLFDEHLFLIDYKLTKGIDLTKERRKTKELLKQLEEAKREARRAGREEPTPEEVKRHVEAPPLPRPPAWTSRLERKLEDVFKAAFTREGMRATPFMSEYRIELVDITMLPTEDAMVAAVEAFAREIVLREQARKVKPPTVREPRLPPAAPTAPPGAPWEERDIEPYAEMAVPEYPPRPMSEMPFPRLPAGIELDLIEDRFLYDLMICGIYSPELFLPQFRKNFAEVLFKSWDDMRKAYDLLVESICKGLEVRYPAERRALPYESIEEGVYWLVSQKRFQSAEEIAAELHELGTPATAEEVRIFIRKGYEQRVPNFVIVTRDYLEQLLGEPLQ